MFGLQQLVSLILDLFDVKIKFMVVLEYFVIFVGFLIRFFKLMFLVIFNKCFFVLDFMLELKLFMIKMLDFVNYRLFKVKG